MEGVADERAIMQSQHRKQGPVAGEHMTGDVGGRGGAGHESLTREGERLRESEQARAALRALFDSALDAILVATDDREYVDANPAACELLGVPRDELLGSRLEEFVPEGQEDAARAAWDEFLESGWMEGEIALRRADGAVRFAEFRARAGFLPGQHLSILRDVTERKRREEERMRLLAQRWKARAQTQERKRISRELHDRVAHAMAVAHQSLELHEALKQSDPEMAGAKMSLAKEAIKDAIALTRDLSSRLRNEEVRGGLTATLSDLLEATVPPGVERGLSVEGDEALVPPHVREQLFVILREGVRNAVSHSGAGRVDVGVRVSAGKVAGCVEDDGRGFAEEDVSSGGGMCSMRERAELLGGTLELSSKPGAGTSVRSIIPLNREPDYAA